MTGREKYRDMRCSPQYVTLLAGFAVGGLLYLAYFLANTLVAHRDIIQQGQSKKFWHTDVEAVFVVPNLVHFVYLTRTKDQTFHFTDLVSVLSASWIQRPEKIFFHCNFEPYGEWWHELTQKVKNIYVKHVEIPTDVNGNKISNIYLAADLVKLEALKMYGGIYLDLDVVVVNPLHTLMVYNFSIGEHQDPPKLSLSVMVANKESLFLQKLHASLLAVEGSIKKQRDSGKVAYDVYRKYPKSVHAVPKRLTTPDMAHRHLLFSGEIHYDWKDLYVVHMLFKSDNKVYNPSYIRHLTNMIGEVLRYIYFGSYQENRSKS